jgi:hypothetical protein
MAGYIGVRKVPTTSNGGGIWNIGEQANFARELIWPLTTPPQPVVEYVGGFVVTYGQTITYPVGTNAGCIAIIVHHDQAGLIATPAGFTTVFSTSSDVNGFAKRVSYKVVDEESTVSNTFLGNNGFDSTLVVVRGLSVSSSFSWAYANSGQSTNLTVPVNGCAIVVTSDRGATEYPSLGGSPDYSFTGTATYFRQRTGIYLNKLQNDTISFTDYSDSYGTSGLLFVVT